MQLCIVKMRRHFGGLMKLLDGRVKFAAFHEQQAEPVVGPGVSSAIELDCVAIRRLGVIQLPERVQFTAEIVMCVGDIRV